MRKILFTAADKTVIRVVLDLPGNILNPPKFLQFRGKLYQYKGSGALETNFFHEVESFQIVETDRDYSRLEFTRLKV